MSVSDCVWKSDRIRSSAELPTISSGWYPRSWWMPALA